MSADGLKHPVFPIPQKIELTGERFSIDGKTVVVAASGRADDLYLAQRVAHTIADATRIGVPVVKGDPPRGRNCILISRCSTKGWAGKASKRLKVSKTNPGPEGYALEVSPRKITVIGSNHAGALYGASTLAELLRSEDLRFWFEGARVRDWPYKPVRAVHVFIPGKEQLPYFRRYMERFLLRYKVNTMILEVGGGMRMESHPEISAGWARTVEELYSHGEVVWQYGESCPLGPKGRFQDTTHRGTGYGEYIEADELAAICELARKMNVNVIPEVQSLSHVYQIACPRRDVAELPDALFPEAYCPSNPESYKLIFDIINEYIDVIGCKAVHIGHDEWRTGPLCPKCRKRHGGDLFAEDVIKLWKHLKSKRCDLWMWGDHFVSKHNETARWFEPPKEEGAVWYDFPSTEGAREKVSKATRSRPITITNWSWSMGVETDEQLHEAGFKVVYGNFHGRKFHPMWKERSAKPWILGAGVSSWSAAEEFELGKMHCASAVYGQNLLWSSEWPEPEEIQLDVLARLPGIKSRLVAEALPSVSSPAGERLRALDISDAFNSGLEGAGWDLSALSGAEGRAGRLPYRFGSGKRACVAVRRPDDSKSLHPTDAVIRVRDRFEGLVFWHATSEQGGKLIHAGDQTHFPRESSDLVAVYEIDFADGRVYTVECRDRETIDAWDASLDAAHYHAPHHLVRGKLASGGPLVVCGHEWRNPRADIEIRSIRMKGCRSRAYEKGAPTPTAILLGITGVEKPRLSDYRGG